MPLYAYCLSDELPGEMLEGVAGAGGTSPRILLCEGLGVVVSDFEDERVRVEREQVFAHERVVRSVLERVTPLPFRFGTVVEEERLRDYVKANRGALQETLERVRGSVEMSVKIIWDAVEMRREGLKTGEHPGGEDENRAVGEGAAYLAARRREILGDSLLKERAEELAEWLTARVGEVASDRDVRVRPVASLVVRAAYLVRRDRLNDYQARVSRARKERSGLRFLTSGPWPPYSFSNIKP